MFITSLFLTFFFCSRNCHLLVNKQNSSNLMLTFGSCSKFDYDDPIDIFLSVSKLNPDLFMWLGKILF